jgi:prevent-host-death family protein
MEISFSRAKTLFASLLKHVQRGGDVAVTRRGKPEARLMPFDETPQQRRAREAVRRMRKLAKKMNLGRFDWEEWKKYRDEGRPQRV